MKIFPLPVYPRLPAFLGAGLLSLAAAMPSRASTNFLGSAVMDATGSDQSGMAYSLESGVLANTLNGLGSGIVYSGYGDTYYLLPDRGPSSTKYNSSGSQDDTTSYATRFHSFEITLKDISPAGSVGKAFKVSAKNTATTLFRNEAGQSFTGRSDRFSQGSTPGNNLRFDPESIRVAPDGTLYVSDEYGPSVYHFSRNGIRLETLPVPAKFLISPFKYSGRGSEETLQNTSGRVDNKGLEGLAITPDGSLLLATMQCPLIQDGGDNTRRVRFILFDLKNPAVAPKEFLYLLDADSAQPGKNVSKTSISDAVAINSHQFLIDEREGGVSGKRIYVVDIATATDISGYAQLATLDEATVAGLALPKESPAFMSLKGLTNNTPNGSEELPFGYIGGIPDNIEGLTFGPDLADGRRLLLVTNDNDFLPNGFPNYIMAFAISPGDLPGFQPVAFPKVVGAFGAEVRQGGLPAGTLTVNLTAARAVTGKLVIGGKSYVLRGRVSANAPFTQTIARPGLAPLVVRLTFEPDLNGLPSVRGSVSGGVGEEIFTVESTPAFATAPLPNAAAGRYNATLSGGFEPGQPNGQGWTSFVLSKSATVRGTARLPDNTTVGYSSRLRLDKTFAFSVPVYVKPRGTFSGSLNFIADPSVDVIGSFTLVKPAQALQRGLFLEGFGFSGFVSGDLYTLPARGTPALNLSNAPGLRGQATFSGVDLTVNPISEPFTLSGAGVAVIPAGSPFAMTLRMATPTGLLSGTFTEPGGVKRAFTGVVLRKRNSASGIFQGATQTGTVTINPQSPE